MWRVVFMGSDNVSLATLKKLHQNFNKNDPKSLISHLEVVVASGYTSWSDARIPQVTELYAKENNLLVHFPDSSKTLKNWELPDPSDNGGPFDIGVVVSFGYLLRPHILNKLKFSAINMHPSLLPKYRGPSPITHALLNGDKETGVTIIDIHPTKFDEGNVLMQKAFPIKNNDNNQTLTQSLADFGADCVIETLKSFHSLERIPQSQENVSHAPKLTYSDGSIKFDEHSSHNILCKYKAFSDRHGINAQFNNQNVKLIEISSAPIGVAIPNGVNNNEEAIAGELRFSKKDKLLWVKTNTDWLVIHKLQVEKRKEQSGADFANGYFITKKFNKFN